MLRGGEHTGLSPSYRLGPGLGLGLQAEVGALVPHAGPGINWGSQEEPDTSPFLDSS